MLYCYKPKEYSIAESCNLFYLHEAEYNAPGLLSDFLADRAKGNIGMIEGIPHLSHIVFALTLFYEELLTIVNNDLLFHTSMEDRKISSDMFINTLYYTMEAYPDGIPLEVLYKYHTGSLNVVTEYGGIFSNEDK